MNLMQLWNHVKPREPGAMRQGGPQEVVGDFGVGVHRTKSPVELVFKGKDDVLVRFAVVVIDRCIYGWVIEVLCALRNVVVLVHDDHSIRLVRPGKDQVFVSGEGAQGVLFWFR